MISEAVAAVVAELEGSADLHQTSLRVVSLVDDPGVVSTDVHAQAYRKSQWG